MRFGRSRVGATLASLFILVLVGIGLAADAPKPGDDVRDYLDKTADWYRKAAALGQSPVNSQEVLFRDTVRQTSRQAMRLGFDFGRAEAALLSAEDRASHAAAQPPPAPAPSTSTAPASQPAHPSSNPAAAPAADRSARLAQKAEAAAARVTQVRAQLDDLNAQLKTAAPDAVASLTAKRDRVQAELNLETARRDVLRELAGFMSDRAEDPGDVLLQAIENLERSIPDAPEATGAGQAGAQNAGASAASTPAKSFGASGSPGTASGGAAAEEAFHPESAGIFALISGMFTLSSRMNELSRLADEAKTLQADNEKLHAPLRAQLQDATRRADAITNAPATDDPAKLLAQRQDLDALTDRFKSLAAAGVPLREQGVLLGSTRTNLLDWRHSLGDEFTTALRSLLFRVGGMVVAILLLLGFSKVWRHATFRYIHDLRRRRQFLVVRRFVVGILIVLIIVATFVSEFGSLATFAGILTAGIAVALQSFILSGVAYFFFIGRYGVRVGERVTVAGTTGDVVDIGLFRLYLMELGGTGLDRHPTGRIVVFSNSVLFQPQAFFKQLPGAEYGWHQVSVPLAAGSDYAQAEARVTAAVEAVFAGYRDAIDRQHASMTRAIHIQSPPPRPQGRLRFTDAGTECVVRYPVELGRATEIDDQVFRRVFEAVAREPRVQVGGPGVPKIMAAD